MGVRSQIAHRVTEIAFLDKSLIRCQNRVVSRYDGMTIHIHDDPQQLVSFKAPIDLVERIDRACISFSCTKSSLIRQLLHHGLNQLPQIPTPVEQIETFAAEEE